MSLPFKPPDKKSLLRKYSQLSPLYERLIEELCFMLEKSIIEQNIKIHGIQHRVKDFDSFYNKIIMKKIAEGSFNKIDDVAGIRIICLYRKDLAKIGKLISQHTNVIEADVKTESSKETEFGYMADHYIVKLPKACKGPRYDDIKPLKCEIQVRTILMDAWDSVSHHLDYKQEIDIPSKLKRDFHALSGLFYVADTHFEMFRDSVERSKSQLIESVKKDQFDLGQEMNLDTLRVYLKWKLPDRERTEDTEYSELLSELQKTGYSDFGRLDEALNKSLHASEISERDDPPIEQGPNGELVPTKYCDVGFVRNCLDILDPVFLNFRIKKHDISKPRDEKLKKYKDMIGVK